VGWECAWLLALVVLYQQFAPSPCYRYVLAWLRNIDLSYIATAVSADLISPGFSLWTFSPVLLPGIVGAYRLIRARRWREFVVPLTVAVSFIVGYSLFPVSLVWRHEGWPADLAPFDYSVNVSLVGPEGKEGKVVAQYAGSPLGSFGALSRWTQGLNYRDNHALAVPADVPPGDYELRVLMYDWRDGKPPPVRNAPDGSPRDHAVIARVHISPVSSH
jgi:hypothetical protein